MQNPFNRTGKLSEHLWLPKRLSVDPAMAREIRDLADQDCRKIQDQLRWLIKLGLEESRRRHTSAALAREKQAKKLKRAKPGAISIV